MSGVVGVDPSPFTLRELSLMFESKLTDEWNRTASLMTLISNALAGKGRKFKISDFHPVIAMKQQAEKPIEAGIEALKMLIPKGARNG